ncbi:MAG TPA: cell division protein, partial [Saprospiraceae bacterium]|nr:cell division protein [Saprospiraceae bacterium]
RFDRIIFVPPPDESARQSIFRLKLKDKPVENIDFQQLAKKTEHYSGADIEAVIDLAVEEKLTDAFQTGQIQALRTKDLLTAITKHKPSTSEWLATAKNYALFANNSGLYDDVLSYLKIKK